MKNKFDAYLFGGIWTILNIVLFHTNPLYPFLFLKIPLVNFSAFFGVDIIHYPSDVGPHPTGWLEDWNRPAAIQLGWLWMGGRFEVSQVLFFSHFWCIITIFLNIFSMELSLVLRSPGWLKYYNLDRNDAYIYIYIVMICIYMHTCITSATTRRLIIDG